MKRKRVFWLFILVLCLLLLCNCQDTDNITSDKEDETCDTDVVEVPAYDRFVAAAHGISQCSEYSADIKVTFEKKTGTASYTEEYEIKGQYHGVGTEDFCAEINSRGILGDSELTIFETYEDGHALVEIVGQDIIYASEMGRDAYLERVIPVCMFDGTGYSSVTYDHGTFVFSEATALEGWAVPEYAQLVSAHGSAKTSENGAVLTMHYAAEYVQGPSRISAQYSVVYSKGGEEAEISKLSHEKRQIEVSDIDVPYSLAYAYEMLSHDLGNNVKGQENIISYASGHVYNAQLLYANWGKGEDALCKVSENISLRNSDGGATSKNTEYIYRDSVCTLSVDGSEAERVDVTYASLVEHLIKSNKRNIIGLQDMNIVSVDTLAEFTVIEYELPLEYGRMIEEEINLTLYGDEHFLDRYASDYTTVSLTGYVCIDNDTRFIVGSGTGYTGEYTIGSDKFGLEFFSSFTSEKADALAYTEITGEPLPDAEVQADEMPTPVFYEITSQDGNKMYLLGTIHVGDSRTGYLPKEILEALCSSDALAVEIDTDDIENRIMADAQLLSAYMKGSAYQDNTTVKEHIPETLYRKNQLLSKLCGDTVYFDYYLPSYSADLFNNYLICSANALYSEKGVEQRLKKIAQDNAIDIIEVEDISLSLSRDSEYSSVTQTYLLDSALSMTRAESSFATFELYEMWCEGDEQKIMDYLMEDEGIGADAGTDERYAIEEYNRILLDERDEQMTEKAREYMNSDKTVFMAVGLAHVLGDGGIIDILRNDGYVIERVDFK